MAQDQHPALWTGSRCRLLGHRRNPPVEMLPPTRENILRAVWNRLRVEPRNIQLDEIIDELGLCTGEDLTMVRFEVMTALSELQVPADIVNGRLTYFPEAI
jgi:hypothetical protein